MLNMMFIFECSFHKNKLCRLSQMGTNFHNTTLSPRYYILYKTATGNTFCKKHNCTKCTTVTPETRVHIYSLVCGQVEVTKALWLRQVKDHGFCCLKSLEMFNNVVVTPSRYFTARSLALSENNYTVILLYTYLHLAKHVN